jgi:hypothetical protein
LLPPAPIDTGIYIHTIRSLTFFFSGGVIIGLSGLEAAVRTLRYTTQVLPLWPSGLHIMHDAYTKMPFPPYPLTLTTCVTSRLFFYQHRHKTQKDNSSAENGKKGEGVESFDRSRFRLSSLPWRLPSTIPSIKTKPPKVGYRPLNHVSPQTPLENA